MHYAISNEVAKSQIATWRRQAEREAFARAAEPASATSPRATRMRRAIAAAYRSSRARAIVAAVAR